MQGGVANFSTIVLTAVPRVDGSHLASHSSIAVTGINKFATLPYECDYRHRYY